MKKSIIQEKSFSFAVRIVKLCKHLTEKKKDFIAKLSIAYKEAWETGYWLKILKETDFLTPKEFDSIYTDLEEIQKILTRILKTSKKNYQ